MATLSELMVKVGADTSSFTKSMKDVEKSSKNAGDKISDSMEDASGSVDRSSSAIMGSLKKLGGVLAGAFAVDKLKDFTVSSIEASAEAEALSAQFGQVFGDMQGEATKSLEKMGNEFGMVPSRIQAPLTQMTSMFKGLGMDTEEAMTTASDAVTLVADASAFYDKSFEDANAALNSFIKGNYEGGEAIGLFANETQMASWASKELGVDWQTLDEKGKQVARLKFAEAMQKAAGATGQASRESDSYQNQLGNLQQTWTDLKARLAQPILEPVIQGLKGLANWLGKVDVEKIHSGFKTFGGFLKDTFTPLFQDVKAGIEGVYNVLEDSGAVDKAKEAFDKFKDALGWVRDNGETVSAVILGLGGAFATFKVIAGINKAIGLYNTLMVALRAGTLKATIAQLGLNTALLANPFTWVAIGVGALIAVIILLWKNWDKVSAWLKKSWESIKEVASNTFDGIKTAVKDSWESVKKKTSEVWDGITAFFKKWGTTILAVVLAPVGGILILVVKHWDKIKETTQKAWDNVKQFVSDAITKTKDTLSSIMSTISANVTSSWTKIKDTINNLMQKAKDIIINAWSIIKTTFSDAVSNVMSTVSSFKTNITNRFTEIKNSVVQKIKDLVSEMKSKFSNGVGDLVDEAKGIPKKIGDGIKNAVNNVTDGVKALGNKVIDTFKSALGIHSPSKVFEKLGGFIIEGLKNGLTVENIKSFASKTFSKVTDGALSAWSDLKTFFSGNTLSGIKSFFSSMGGNIKDFFNGSIGAVGSGVQRWRGVAAQALMMTGQFSAHNLERLLYQMQTESGGNPRAINLWDINAKRGIPSKGLMQVIDPTFQSYKMPGFNNIWNPLDNILASIRYAVSRYGSLTRAYRGVGYAKGGVFKGTQEGSLIHMAEKGGDEAVVPLSRKRYMAPFANAIAEHLESDDGGKTVYQNNITLNATIREEADINKIAKEIVREQKKMERAGGKRK